MTREELKEHCKKQIEMCEMWAKAKGEKPCGKVYEEHKMILELLEQQPCEDCISRQAVLDGLASIAKVKARSDAQKSLMGRVMFFVEQLPSVTPKEKTGKWYSTTIQGEIDGQIVRAFTCSKCGAISIFRVSNENIVNGDLCPNCGCQMVKPQESEGKECQKQS